MSLVDVGLQPERTELAWRRTCLSVALGSLIAIRLLPAVLGSAWAVLPGIAGVLAAAVLWIAARRRIAAANHVLLQSRGEVRLPDAGLVFATAAATVGLGLAALTVVLLAAT